MSGGMVGRVYLLRGEPVEVLARWRGNGCPRNVLLKLPDGRLTVRPFRGLRRLPSDAASTVAHARLGKKALGHIPALGVVRSLSGSSEVNGDG